MMPLRNYPSLLAATLVLAGCTVGPDYVRPSTPKPERYTVGTLSTTTSAPTQAGTSQRFVEGQAISAEWWTLFGSSALNALVAECLRNNADISAGQATLRAARENVIAQEGAYYPTVSAGFSATRQQTSAVLSPTTDTGALTFNLFSPQLNVSYTPDVFGLNRRTVQSLSAQAEQVRFAMLATRITLVTNLVSAFIQEASLKSQLASTEALIENDTQILEILRTQLKKGYIAQLDVAAQESELAQTQALLPPLRKQLAIQHDLVATLVGSTPDQPLVEPSSLSDLSLPMTLPVSLPSSLIEQRPDIRQAEENVHSASAQIGIAVANRLPNFTLTADAGSMALTLGQMFSSGASFWTLGAAVAQPIFDGGQLLHKERAARATYDAAVSQYRSAVLNAFQNVADTLNSLQQDSDGLARASAAADAAADTLKLSKQQVSSGYANSIVLLNAERSYHQSEITLIQARSARFSDTAALFQALGGGWWNMPAETSVAASR